MDKHIGIDLVYIVTRPHWRRVYVVNIAGAAFASALTWDGLLAVMGCFLSPAGVSTWAQHAKGHAAWGATGFH